MIDDFELTPRPDRADFIFKCAICEQHGKVGGKWAREEVTLWNTTVCFHCNLQWGYPFHCPGMSRSDWFKITRIKSLTTAIEWELKNAKHRPKEPRRC